jgi:hypothetical protein
MLSAPPSRNTFTSTVPARPDWARAMPSSNAGRPVSRPAP